MNSRKEPRVVIKEEELLSNAWRPLRKFTLDYEVPGKPVETQVREVYQRGNGAAILLYNLDKNTFILTRQFRLPTYINQNPSGMLVEVCAGLLENETAEDCIRREVLEETGYRINEPEFLFKAYMTPGADTELLYFFMAEYKDEMKASVGGGLDSEQEDIEVLEWDIDLCLDLLEKGQFRDAKTIILLQQFQIMRAVKKQSKS